MSPPGSYQKTTVIRIIYERVPTQIHSHTLEPETKIQEGTESKNSEENRFIRAQVMLPNQVTEQVSP